MTSTFKLKSVIVEEAPAWVECGRCEGSCQIRVKPRAGGHAAFQNCPACNGDGGKWNSLIKDDPSLGLMFNTKGKLWFPFNGAKSSILTRTHEICGECKGNTCGITTRKTYCDNCENTGAEPGTASEWEEREDDTRARNAWK